MSDDPNRSPRPGETNLSAKNSAASAAAVFAGLQRGLELQGGSVFDLADVVLTALLELGIEMDVGAALVDTVASKAPSCVELWNDRLEYEVPIATNKFGRSLWRRPPEESWGPHQAEVIGAAALLPDRTFNPCSPAELEIFRWTYEGCMEDEPSAQHERSDDALVIALVRWRSCRPTYCELHREGLWMVEGGRWVMRQGFAKRRSYWVHRAGM